LRYNVTAPQIAGADFDPPGRPVMRMTGDAQRFLPADLAQDVLSGLIRADVRVLLAADVVLGDFGAGDHQQVVELSCAARFRRNVVEIGLETFRRGRAGRRSIRM
jgi:hypothetical protein